MNEKILNSYRWSFIGLITIAIWSLLIWSHFHGGVTSHHLLHREDLPAISNWWSGLLIPLLSWFLLYRVQKRIMRNKDERSLQAKFPTSIVYGFIIALSYGALVSVLFILKFASIPGYFLLGLWFIALFYPVYRAECILGFVLGMTIAFGAVLSTAISVVISLGAVFMYLIIRPAILFIISKLFHKVSTTR